MAVNVTVQYNDINLLTQCYYYNWGTRLIKAMKTVDPMLLLLGNPINKCHEDVLSPMIPPKRFDIFSP